MLAGGLTLIVPALVISLNAVADDDPVEELPTSDGERAEPPQPAGGAPAAPPASGSGSVNLGAQRALSPSDRKIARATQPRRATRPHGAVDVGGAGDGAYAAQLSIFADALITLAPLERPAFAFAWLGLVSHRHLLPKCLLQRLHPQPLRRGSQLHTDIGATRVRGPLIVNPRAHDDHVRINRNGVTKLISGVRCRIGWRPHVCRR